MRGGNVPEEERGKRKEGRKEGRKKGRKEGRMDVLGGRRRS